jgi:hypothetical protein
MEGRAALIIRRPAAESLLGETALAVLARTEGRPEHIARMSWYLTSRGEYLDDLEPIGAACRGVMGKRIPAMTAVEVTVSSRRGRKWKLRRRR